MKHALASVAAFITVSLAVGCQSRKMPDTTMERIQSEDTARVERTGDTDGCSPYKCKTNDYEHQTWTDMDTEIVELQQGRVAALTLDLCHTDHKPLSNRRRAECDKIVAEGRRIEARRAAEEKGKDDAYDKAHKAR